MPTQLDIVPVPPRYDLRQLPITECAGTRTYGVFDTFTQEFVVGQGPFTNVEAIGAVRRHNEAYRRAMLKTEGNLP